MVDMPSEAPLLVDQRNETGPHGRSEARATKLVRHARPSGSHRYKM